jgi:hypothetical protein
MDLSERVIQTWMASGRQEEIDEIVSGTIIFQSQVLKKRLSLQMLPEKGPL